MGPPLEPFNTDSIRRAASVVARGGLIVYPTDTVYGLGCDPADPKAVERLFRAKGRDAKPIPIICSGIPKVRELVEMSPKALDLSKRYWPGAMTMVLPLRTTMPFLLHQGTGSLGVRVPGSTKCLELVKACGGWLTGTSANVSGRPSARSAEEAMGQLGDKVDLYLDGGRLGGRESTVVRVVGDELMVLRRGPVGVKDAKMKR
jgi:L-threonylcarbamoyladenylate synthase